MVIHQFDSYGRILIPVGFRSLLNMNSKSHIKITIDEKKGEIILQKTSFPAPPKYKS